MGMSNNAAIVESSMAVPKKKSKQIYHIIQQSHFWVYSQKREDSQKERLREISLYPWTQRAFISLFIAALFTITKKAETTQMSTDK